MSYEQWEEQFKKNLRRYYKRKLKDIVDNVYQNLRNIWKRLSKNGNLLRKRNFV